MGVIYIMVPVALVLVAAAVIAFTWAVSTGQLDDLETPGMRILLDDEEAETPPASRPPVDGTDRRR